VDERRVIGIVVESGFVAARLRIDYNKEDARVFHVGDALMGYGFDDVFIFCERREYPTEEAERRAGWFRHLELKLKPGGRLIFLHG
jgi:hypothetical protein